MFALCDITLDSFQDVVFQHTAVPTDVTGEFTDGLKTLVIVGGEVSDA